MHSYQRRTATLVRTRHGLASRGMAWSCEARPGKAWRDMVGQGGGAPRRHPSQLQAGRHRLAGIRRSALIHRGRATLVVCGLFLRAASPGSRNTAKLMEQADVERRGRLLLLRDADGGRYAVSVTALLIACATEDGGTVAHFAGGKALKFEEDLEVVVSWFC